jgi:hypothetical protein
VAAEIMEHVVREDGFASKVPSCREQPWQFPRRVICTSWISASRSKNAALAPLHNYELQPANEGECIMRETTINLPTIALVAGTRVGLGIGLGLLLSDHFTAPEKRRAVGWTLIAAGALSTIPLAAEVFGGSHPAREAGPRGLSAGGRQSLGGPRRQHVSS